MSDDFLRKAAAALRQEHDGSHPNAGATKLRILAAAKQKERSRRRIVVIAMPLAAAFIVGTAWAGASGKLSPLVHAVEGAFGAAPSEEKAELKSAGKPTATSAAETATTAPTSEPSAEAKAEQIPPPDLATPPSTPSSTTPPRGPTTSNAPGTAIATAASTPRPAKSHEAVASTSPKAEPSEPTFPTPPPAAAPSAGEPGATLYMDAHRVHFVEKDPARAVGAWDAYLRAAPQGRFAPEARYNRAIMLVRLGRRDDAIRELRPFADGAFGGYRRDDAKALIEALENGK